MIDLYDELYLIVETLTAHDIDFALCGGLAVSFHVAPRATVDIDLLVRMADFERIRTALAPKGYEHHSNRMVFDGGRMVIDRLVKLIPATKEYLVADFLFADPLADPTIWRDRLRISWRGLELSVLGIQGLISLKRSRLSDQDKTDIANLEKKLAGSR